MRLAAFAVVLLLMPGALAWTQLHGDAGHHGTAPALPPVLDAVAVHALDWPELPQAVHHPAFVDTPAGGVATLWSTRDFTTCILVTVGQNTAGVPIEGCANPRLVGYSQTRDQIVVCGQSTGAAPVLMSINRTTQRPSLSVAPEDLPGNAPLWTCGGAALSNDGRLVTAMMVGWDNGRAVDNWLVQYDLSNGFRSTTPATVSRIDVLGVINNGAPDVLETGLGAFHPRAVTLTANHVVVSGFVCEGLCVDDMAPGGPVANPTHSLRPAVAWFDSTGLLGLQIAATGPTQQALGASSWAVARDGVVLWMMDGALWVLDPESGREPEALDIPRVRSWGNNPLPAVLWGEQLVLVGRDSLQATDATTLEPQWSWNAPAGNTIEDSMLAGRDVFVLSSNTNDPGALTLSRIAPGGQLTQQWPVAGGGASLPAGERGKLAYIDGNVWAFHRNGQLTQFATAEPALAPVDTMYPAVGAGVALNLPENVEAHVAWGDGDHETATGPVQHAYSSEGTHRLVVTIAGTDGTASQERLIHVGRDPPTQLNWVQDRFAPENQDMTWGVIGLAVVLAGAAFGLLGRRMRRGRLEGRLARIETLAKSEDQETAVAALDSMWHELHTDLGRGRVDDAEFGVLMGRLGRHLRALRKQACAPFTQGASDRFLSQLDGSLIDGNLSPGEGRVLLEGLEREPRIPSPSKAELSRLLRQWAGL